MADIILVDPKNDSSVSLYEWERRFRISFNWKLNELSAVGVGNYVKGITMSWLLDITVLGAAGGGYVIDQLRALFGETLIKHVTRESGEGVIENVSVPALTALQIMSEASWRALAIGRFEAIQHQATYENPMTVDEMVIRVAGKVSRRDMIAALKANFEESQTLPWRLAALRQAEQVLEHPLHIRTVYHAGQRHSLANEEVSDA